MPDQRKSSRSILVLLLAITLLAPGSARAIDAGDMDPQLPKEVVLASMRFRAYTRKADNQKHWEKKQAELLKLLETQLEKASTSNSRTATALRSLITDLKDAKYVAPKPRAKTSKTDYPILPDGNKVMVKSDFLIDKPENRVLTYTFEIKQVPAMIRLGIGGGSDDSGDGGLHYLMLDPVGQVIKRGFANIDEFIWEKHQCTRSGTWKVIIEDLDTDLEDKKSPGNRGAIEVLVNSE